MLQHLKKQRHFISKIKLSFILILSISSLITFLLWQSFNDLFLPISINLIERVDGNPSSIKIYKDLNNDGYSESLNFGEIEEKKLSVLVVRKYSGVVDEQFNLNGKIIENGILFGDLNSDNYEEIIVFYDRNDSLYYDVIDLAKKSYPIKKQLFITKPDSASGNNWDLMIAKGSKVIDLNADGIKELVVGLRTGYAVYPRAIYTYSFQKKEIINKLEISAPIENIYLKDLNDDGFVEIFFTTQISGNVHSSRKFNDQTSWMFLVDHNLDFIIPPKYFGNYPTSQLYAKDFLDNNFILVESSTQDKINNVYILNGSLGLENVKKINYETIYDLFVSVNRKDGLIYLSTNDGDIIQIDQNFETIRVISTELTDLKFISVDDYGMSNENKLLVGNNDEIRLYNENLNLLGKLNINPGVSFNDYYITKRNTGIDNNSQIGLASKNSNLLINFEQNKTYLYLYLYPLLVFVFLIVIIILYLLKNIILQFYFYFKSFLHLFYKTETGFCLVDKNLKIKYLNQNFSNYLKLHNSETKDLFTLLADHKSLNDLISKALETKNDVNEKLFTNAPGLQFKGDINVIPLKIFNKKVIAILIEVRNYTQPILDDRLKIWGKSIQKIAHDIKTPLSTIALNLKSIQLNLEKSGINNEEVSRDIDAAKNEIERIKNLTKDFLKFVDLEKPSFQAISADDVIINSLKRFDPLRNEDLKIDFASNDLNKNIWADPRQIELVIHILVENAIDAVKGKGLILIETDLVQNLASNNEEMVQISVIDNGSGIEKEFLDKIFEPHFSTKNDGTGMGLAFAKKIIEDHKGEIDLHSKEGFGTTFRFTLPVIRNT